MKLISYIYQDQSLWGHQEGDSVYPAKEGSLLGYIEGKCPADFDAQPIPLSEIKLLSPIPNPRRNILCVGRNYFDHVMELNDWDEAQRHSEQAAFFTKVTTAMTGPYSDIPLHEGITSQLDYEVELAVIVGKQGSNITAEQAMDYVFGYTILNDVSARDLQKNHLQWFKGKSLDGCAPMGPCIVTRDEISDPHSLGIQSKVNGKIRQSSNTKLMIWKIPDLIAILSQGMTLLPGDIISTGTPAGVGIGMNPPRFLSDGDVVTCTIEGIGSIENKIAK